MEIRQPFLLIALLCTLFSVEIAASEKQNLPQAPADADYWPVDLQEAALGQLLFYDPILSGNRNVACATCHHPKFATADGVSLSFGDGGIGLGPARRVDPANPPEQRIPRNAPALFNLGAKEFTVMFHDGRLEAAADHPGGIRTPMDADMTQGFASILSAQTMFPVLSRDEMAGSYDENDVAKAVRQGRITGPDGAWNLLSQRVGSIPEYVALFEATYPHILTGSDIAFTDISNAIAAFMAIEWRSDNAPFDAFLRGEAALNASAMRGLDLFYTSAGCAACHSGPFLTDHSFHAMGAPQIGPGKAASFETHQRDEGRFRVTGRAEDLYAFRTPSLRNVTLTAPYGHAGGHRDLAAFIKDHIHPAVALDNYTIDKAILPVFEGNDFAVMADQQQRRTLKAAITTTPITLSDQEISDILSFLSTLTDKESVDGRLGIPETVPSGLRLPN
ncbi:MAG: cytochrome c peroxidase [Pseudomonadota bacterium]